MVFAPPLPCLPPPGVPAENRTHSTCYCSGSRASHHLSESAYSEAHYTPTVPGHPCYPTRPDHLQHTSCPSTHVYASTTPLPPYPDSSNSRTSPGSPSSCQKRLSRNSAVYESASLQYAPAGYYLPPSMTSSFTSTSSSHENQGVAVSCGSGNSVERAVQSSLPSLTYQALKALGEDIEAFRHLHQLTDDDSSSARESQKSPTASTTTTSSHHPPSRRPPLPLPLRRTPTRPATTTFTTPPTSISRPRPRPPPPRPTPTTTCRTDRWPGLSLPGARSCLTRGARETERTRGSCPTEGRRKKRWESAPTVPVPAPRRNPRSMPRRSSPRRCEGICGRKNK
ncbi:mucin-2-like [Macrobrachium nipponense]|uniref:mucin-2-like n=1 Tax=Macrobrachium nipponense TaxID=159736 RepID=UPI0030C838C4